ncbi:MAG: hypothetical protein QOE37_2104 [Microbacteriaceae bacterium]|nr:hypothetical protein [Microbacteriaceae bacterium]
MHAFPSLHRPSARLSRGGSATGLILGLPSRSASPAQPPGPRIRDLVAARVLQAGFAVRLQQFHDLHPHPSDGPGFAVDGPDPLRVLLIGAGLGVGYGVCVAGLALPGHLARLTANRLGRGAIVDNLARPGLALTKTVPLVASAGLGAYQAVVYLPAFTDVTRGAGPSWVASLDELIQAVRLAGPDRLQIVLTGLPEPQGVGVLDDASRSLAVAQNATMARRAAGDPLIHYVAMPPVDTLAEGPVFDAAYFRRCAERLAPVLRDRSRVVRPLPRAA